MFRLQSLDPTTGELLETELPLSPDAPEAGARLRAPAGASALHVAVVDGDAVRWRAEIPADPNEAVLVSFELGGDGHLAVTSPGRHVLALPPDERYAPRPPLEPAPDDAPLDLALVVDGTARSANGALLDDAEAWGAWVDQVVAFVSALVSRCPAARLAVVAFGDEAPPRAKAMDLHPRYLLHPGASEIRLGMLDPETLRTHLLALPASPGGDFVDAVADAFAACRRLRWRPEARKFLVLFGDSPGHSIRRPAPTGGDASVRERDVEHEALGLHEAGVEVATIYHERAFEGARELDFKARLLDFARAQYRALASRPENAFATTEFEPIGAAEAVLARTGLLGREAVWGERIE